MDAFGTSTRRRPFQTMALALLAAMLGSGCDQSPESRGDSAGASAGATAGTTQGLSQADGSAGRTPAPPDGGLSALIDSVEAQTQATSDAPVALTIAQPERPDRLLFLGLEAPISPLWQWQPTRSAHWLAEWVIPGTQGGEPAQLIIWRPKVDRESIRTSAIPEWERQFRTGVLPTRARVEDRNQFDVPVTLIELSGDYSGMGGGWHRPDFRQLTAIADGPNGTIGIRLLGPSQTVETHRDAFMRMVEGLRLIH